MLKIMTDATSPFGRKVVVAALERGLEVAEQFVDMKAPQPLAPFNPLWQIPTLVLSERAGVYDSMAILLHLDTLHEQAPLVRVGDAAALSMLSLADGLMEAVLARRVESLREAARQDDGYLAKLEARILRARSMRSMRAAMSSATHLAMKPAGCPRARRSPWRSRSNTPTSVMRATGAKRARHSRPGSRPGPRARA